MPSTIWERHWQPGRGQRAIEKERKEYQRIADDIRRRGELLRGIADAQLRAGAVALRQRLSTGATLDELLPEFFALTCELAHRVLALRPFDVQITAAVALHHGRLIEMQTGEGKTLAAVLPVALHALAGRGVHVLTFNEYLARRDADWMRPIYVVLGLSVDAVQSGMNVDRRRAAYAADVTYATAKEAGFDFLRASLARDSSELVQRPFHCAIIDEADSILIDEASVPLVIAGAREISEADPARIAAVVKGLAEGIDWERDENARNVHLTEQGNDRVESLLKCGSLHGAQNALLLGEVNQALHARALLRRDVDYIVRDGRIVLIDECTGRVVSDRRWPDGLQAALEAKEALSIQPGGRILGSITLQHFLAQYPTLAGMTATAQPAADELSELYGLQIMSIPPNRPCIREDLPDIIFTHVAAKEQALVAEIAELYGVGRPVLVGTSSVEESEHIAALLSEANISYQVLNAKNDEAEAGIVAEAGAIGAVTISTAMAGRGTDIRLGGANEKSRDEVVALGGLHVIGTSRNESQRIDDQLRGRAGRQGDPGSSRFYVSLEDPLMVRFGVDKLIPRKLRPPHQAAPIDHPVIRREVARTQRIVEGQNQEIRATLARYSAVIEQQRATLAGWRSEVLSGDDELSFFADREPARFAQLVEHWGAEKSKAVSRSITLDQIDVAWAEHLAFVSDVREGIHLVGIGGMDPFNEFHRRIAQAFGALNRTIENRVVQKLIALDVTNEGLLDLASRGPSSTWTYLINDRAVTELHRMLHGPGSSGFSAAAVLLTWPLLMAWALWRMVSKKGRGIHR